MPARWLRCSADDWANPLLQVFIIGVGKSPLRNWDKAKLITVDGQLNYDLVISCQDVAYPLKALQRYFVAPLQHFLVLFEWLRLEADSG